MLMLMIRPGDAEADDHDRDIHDGQHLTLSYSSLEPRTQSHICFLDQDDNADADDHHR